MRVLTTLFAGLLLTACVQKAKEEKPEPETVVKDTPVAEEWQVLFDGSSFDGWHVYGGGNIDDAWKLIDGAMVLQTDTHRTDGNRFNMVTDGEFTNFVLQLDWRVSSGANSGVMWGVVEIDSLPEPYHTGPEIQVLDNIDHPDAKNGTSHQAGSLYDMVSPNQDVTKPVGEWNTYEITIDYSKNYGKVVLNGVEIVNFALGDEAWDTMVAESKFATWPAFGKTSTGKIALQDHGEPLEIAYRNIKIKEL